MNVAEAPAFKPVEAHWGDICDTIAKKVNDGQQIKFLIDQELNRPENILFKKLWLERKTKKDLKKKLMVSLKKAPEKGIFTTPVGLTVKFSK